jgi:hypothetical protein
MESAGRRNLTKIVTNALGRIRYRILEKMLIDMGRIDQMRLLKSKGTFSTGATIAFICCEAVK